MKVFELPENASPRARGHAHGEAFRGMIAELAEIRLALTVELGGFPSAELVLDLAARHLPVLAGYDAALHDELVGIAEGAALDAARVVVLNHYTDLRDIAPAEAVRLSREEGCSAVYTRTAGSALLGQTWDMHGSAEPYVMMLRAPEEGDAPAAWLFTITGCLGMTGLNASGLGITINNLNSLDAKVGLVWPALVRRVLRESDVDRARHVVLTSPLGSGHHYLLAAGDWACGIETSGEHRKVVYDGTALSYVHTNHCVDAEMGAVHTISPESTTHARFDALTSSLDARSVTDRPYLWRRLGSHDGYPRSLCTHLATPEQPHRMRTCGAIVMDLFARDLWAAPGCVNHSRHLRFGFTG